MSDAQAIEALPRPFHMSNVASIGVCTHQRRDIRAAHNMGIANTRGAQYKPRRRGHESPKITNPMLKLKKARNPVALHCPGTVVVCSSFRHSELPVSFIERGRAPWLRI